jgi:hypothetical protein
LNRTIVTWHPIDEAEACSRLAALLEWLRATNARDDMSPATLRAWSVADPPAFANAVDAAFGPTDPAMRARRIADLFDQWDAIRQPASDPATP